MPEFFQRLKQRKLVQWAIAYVAAAFALLQGIDIVANRFDWPPQTIRLVILGMIVGFFVTLVLAWYHGERGAQKVSGAELAILATLVSLGGFFLWHFAGASQKPILADLPNEYKNPIPAKSIAVLPFESLSSDKDNAFFASGIQDMILTKLAGIKDLKVISRTSTERYASHPENLKDIAQELGVAKILEGSVQKSNNSVLINVQMIDAATDAHLWAQAYPRTLENIFGVEGEVAEKIAEALHAALTGNEREELARKPTDNAAALEAYLKGISLVSSYTSSTEPAIASFRRAVTLDPNFTLAWTALASEELNTFWFAYDPSPSRLTAAKEALERAEALMPDSPEVEMTRAEYLYHGLYDYTGALALLAKVQTRLPNNAHVWFLTALLERRIGQMGAAISHFARARALDPNDRNIVADGNATLVFTGRYDEARASLDRDLERGQDQDLLYELKLITEWNAGGLDAADTFLASLGPESAGFVPIHARHALYRHDFKKASDLFEQAIAQKGDSHTQLVFDGYLPSKIGWLLQQALSEARRGLPAKSKALYLQAQELARAQLATGSGSRNTQAGWHAALGMACAGLGQANEAVAEGRAATALIPLEKDKWEGPDWLGFLAQIYAMNGDAEHATPLIEQVMNKTYVVTPALLSFDPIWDSIRKDARFQALLVRPPPERKAP